MSLHKGQTNSGSFTKGCIPWSKGEKLLHLRGENAAHWKGGRPNCINCGKILPFYQSKRCKMCYIKQIDKKVASNNGKLGALKRWGEHKTHFRTYDKKERNEYQNKWRNAHKEEFRFSKKVRRAREKGAEGTHTLLEWNLLKEFYKFMCLCCKRQEPEITLTEDHIIPLSRGGSNYIENIQPLCTNCNSKKYIKTTNFIKLSGGEKIFLIN